MTETTGLRRRDVALDLPDFPHAGNVTTHPELVLEGSLMSRSARERANRTGSVVLSVVCAIVMVSPTSAQDDSPVPLPPLDGALLVATCEANAGSGVDLEVCLDIVARVLVPGQDVPGASAVPVGDLPFQPVELKGWGDKIARFDIPVGIPAIADIRHIGQGYFGVSALGADGEQLDLLVNTSGKYEGTVLFAEDDGEHAVAFEISADGRWEGTIRPAMAARQWDTTGPLDGTGDDVVLLSAPVAGFASTEITHRGDGYFGMQAYTADGSRELLVNDAGPYEGEVLLPDGTVLLQINAEAGWTASAPE